jgi:hypothetical protein
VALLRALLILPVALWIASDAEGMEEAVEVDAGADKHVIAVGDTFRVDIDLRWQAGVSVKPLALGEKIGEFSVRDVIYGPVSASDSLFARNVSLLLTVFRTGALTVPAVPVVYMDGAGNARRAETEEIDIEVVSVLSGDASEIKDIKAPIEVPKRWKDIITSWALLAGLTMAAAASVLVSVRRREDLECALRRVWLRLSGPVIRLVRWILTRLSLVGRDQYGSPVLDAGIAEPYLTPEQAALKELERIDRMGLPEKGKTMELSTLVSETVRRYLERRLRILAMESPTSHTLAAMRARGIASEAFALVQDLLEQTDLVKFARFEPEGEAAGKLTDRARQVVHQVGGRDGVTAVKGGAGG